MNLLATFQSWPVGLQTVLLLLASNIFMTFAWYGPLRSLAAAPWTVAALVSWGIAFFEYMLQVPANRIGHTEFNVGQLKIMQEVITLTVFLPFAMLYLKGTVQARLRLGRPVHGRGGVFHFQKCLNG